MADTGNPAAAAPPHSPSNDDVPVLADYKYLVDALTGLIVNKSDQGRCAKAFGNALKQEWRLHAAIKRGEKEDDGSDLWGLLPRGDIEPHIGIYRDLIDEAFREHAADSIARLPDHPSFNDALACLAAARSLQAKAGDVLRERPEAESPWWRHRLIGIVEGALHRRATMANIRFVADPRLPKTLKELSAAVSENEVEELAEKLSMIFAETFMLKPRLDGGPDRNWSQNRISAVDQAAEALQTALLDLVVDRQSVEILSVFLYPENCSAMDTIKILWQGDDSDPFMKKLESLQMIRKYPKKLSLVDIYGTTENMVISESILLYAAALGLSAHQLTGARISTTPDGPCVRFVTHVLLLTGRRSAEPKILFEIVSQKIKKFKEGVRKGKPIGPIPFFETEI
ncbi:MAG: hypothetical protein QF666_10540 [Alphaproteobacteria bacterium]|nr:hypothetical protein [Alphaproteobacteria bacterium]MDP6589869.1 hypothetical protein [Alphaproteobacteria bacterium]